MMTTKMRSLSSSSSSRGNYSNSNGTLYCLPSQNTNLRATRFKMDSPPILCSIICLLIIDRVTNF
uniref:Gtpase activating protein n=1 Tax=Rhizophora mucronata TaxID=61149 RepID=A0A2P2IXB0_RHIMU